MILVVGKGSGGAGVLEKMVPTGGSVRSVSPPLVFAAVVVTPVVPMPESTTVEDTIGDLGRTGVDVKIGEPICVTEVSDMVHGRL